MRALLIIAATISGLFAVGVGGCALACLVDAIMGGIEGFGAAIFTLASGCFLLALILGALSRWLFRKASRMSQEP